MRITLVALLAACSAALRCSPQYRPLAQRRCSIVAQAELAPLPSQLGRVAAWAGEVVVVKYGGHAMTDPELSKSFAADCALMQSLGVRLVVVHGGGPQINAMLKKLEIKSEFVAGLRVTDSATMDAAEMVLCGSINKQIASSITLCAPFLRCVLVDVAFGCTVPLCMWCTVPLCTWCAVPLCRWNTE